MPPKKIKEAASVESSAPEGSPVVAALEGSPAKKKTPVSKKEKAPPKKKETNGVAKGKKQSGEDKPASAKKKAKKEATVSEGETTSPVKSAASPKKKKPAVNGTEASSPKKKPAKKRTKADATLDASGGGPSPPKKIKTASSPKKPKAVKSTDETPKSPKKVKKAKAKEGGVSSGTEATPKKKVVKKKAKDSEEATSSGPDGAQPKKAPKKKATKEEGVEEGPAAKKTKKVKEVELDADGNPIKKKRVRKPKAKPEEDEAPVLVHRKPPTPKAKPTLLKKPKVSRNRAPPKPAATEAPTAEEVNEDDDTDGQEEQELEQTRKKETVKKSTPPKKDLQNPTETDWENQQFTINNDFKLKIASWNISGLRAWLGKGGKKYLLHEHPDIVCLQETKCKNADIPEEATFTGYHPYWLGFGGQAGVGIYSRKMPLSVNYGIGNKDFDSEGRLLTAEYEKFFLVNVYVPNSGRKLVTLPKRLHWNKLFKEFIKELDNQKPVIICGDMNVAHEEIDLANPKTNKKTAGFTIEEREGMTDFLGEAGFVDTFRHFYPTKTGAYTFWTYMSNARAKNVGWRLDYILVSKRILDKVVDNQIRSRVMGSDHCPIVGFFNL